MSELLLLPTVVLRGIFVGLLASIAFSLLGVNLVLKRYSMIGDGLSHIAFGAMSVAAVLGFAPLAFSVPIVIVSSILLLYVRGRQNIGGDASIAIVSSSAMAIGICAVSLSGGVSVSVSDYLFGSIVAISRTDALVCVPVLLIVIAVYLLFYNKIFAVTFDEGFAKVSGVKSRLYEGLIAILVSLTVVVGMRIIGTLLVSGLIIFPALSAMKVSRSYRSTVIISVVISLICFVAGTLFSIFLGTPVGASVIIVNGVIFLLCSLIGK